MLLYLHCRARLGPLMGPGSKLGDRQGALDELRGIFRDARPDRLRLDGADFSGADLRGIDFSGADLRGTSFEQARLRRAAFAAADLTDASFRFADVREASFTEARLEHASFDHADAQSADLRRAGLEDADLGFARFAGADLRGAGLEGAGLTGTGFLGARGLDKSVAGGPHARLTPQLGHASHVNSVAWHPDGTLIASGSEDGTVKIWDAVDERLILTLEDHRGPVRSVAWDASGARLASGSSDKTVKIWSSSEGRLIHTLEGHESHVWSVAWDAGDRLAAATVAGSIDLWDLSGPRPRRMARLHPALHGLVATLDGYIDGSPEALDAVRFGDGWALYDLTDLPQRHSPERVREALRVTSP